MLGLLRKLAVLTECVFDPSDPVDRTKRNCGIDDFSNNFCYANFRHRKEHLKQLVLLKNTHKTITLKSTQKLFATPVLKQFVVAALLTNIKTTMTWQGPTFKTFGVPPPSVNDYLA